MRILTCLLLYLSLTLPLQAMTDRDLLEDLLALGELELAAGTHMEIADRENDYQPWKDIGF